MLKKGLIAAALSVALVLTACQNPPVNNIVDMPLDAPPGVTLDQVRQAIMFAGNKRGWQMRQEVPGKIIATHQRSGHMAVVDILYTTTTLSILYYESASLQFDAKNNTVHPTYNRWVDFLAQDIQANAAALASDSGTGMVPVTPPAPAPAPAPAGVAPDATEAQPSDPVAVPDASTPVPATESPPSAAPTQL
ncbi:hypothetical protein [Defluviicoccus vanus]|uniref:Lipoprotein n=1 Tax=Defluviicoccus vanus TaxID=111831 RepID=A0A7H1N288_9PROT|nr:hypothetical protein [Defluviicoccus vanus]QNT69824.1 hypothetical protein HQ394_11490 [Defluviicoccus vanus]